MINRDDQTPSRRAFLRRAASLAITPAVLPIAASIGSRAVASAVAEPGFIPKYASIEISCLGGPRAGQWLTLFGRDSLGQVVTETARLVSWSEDGTTMTIDRRPTLEGWA